MLISDNNKAGFFELEVMYPKFEINAQLFEERKQLFEKQLSVQLDLFFMAVDARPIYKFEPENITDRGLLYFFAIKIRRRKIQILKYLNIFLEKQNNMAEYITPEPLDYTITPIFKKDFEKKIQIYLEEQRKSKEIELLSNLKNKLKYKLKYDGEDLKLFDSKKNWHPWQVELFEKIFYQTGEIRTADHRHIIYLWDPNGGSGKSIFYKFLNYKYDETKKSIAYLNLMSGPELRTELLKCSGRQLYICDIPTSLSAIENKLVDSFLGTVEELKNGVIYNSITKNYKLELFGNPHVILSSNQLLSPTIGVNDRWIIYKIDEKLELVDITKDATELFKKQEEGKEQEKEKKSDYISV